MGCAVNLARCFHTPRHGRVLPLSHSVTQGCCVASGSPAQLSPGSSSVSGSCAHGGYREILWDVINQCLVQRAEAWPGDVTEACLHLVITCYNMS